LYNFLSLLLLLFFVDSSFFSALFFFIDVVFKFITIEFLGIDEFSFLLETSLFLVIVSTRFFLAFPFIELVCENFSVLLKFAIVAAFSSADIIIKFAYWFGHIKKKNRLFISIEKLKEKNIIQKK